LTWPYARLADPIAEARRLDGLAARSDSLANAQAFSAKADRVRRLDLRRASSLKPTPLLRN
jgi:hypothetical protein